MNRSQSICAILFYLAEPTSLKRLASLLRCREGDIKEALSSLESSLEAVGLRLIQNGEDITLGTAPEAGPLIETMTKEELSKELSKASLETIAIILYKGPVTRSEIDYIRGVNSTFILRNLLVRGLVEKTENPKDQRSYLYKPTFELLEFMGVTKTEELPQYSESMAALEQFIKQKEADTNAETREQAMDSADEEADTAEKDLAAENFSAIEGFSTDEDNQALMGHQNEERA